MVLTSAGKKKMPVCMDWQQKVSSGFEENAPMMDYVDSSQQKRHTAQLISVSHENRATAVKFFCTLSSSRQPSMKGTSDKQTNISVSIVMYEWPVLFPETSRCLGRQGSPIKKALCQKPVITAIIQLDLICIIKLCYCLAVEATLRPCSYQMDDLGHLREGYILRWPLNVINQYYDKPLKWSW